MVNMFASTEKSSADVIRRRLNGAECSRTPVDPVLHHGAQRMKRRSLDENGNLVNVPDVVKRVRWSDEDKRRVASTEIGEIQVRTHCRPLDRRPL
jgi:hypothetical protein